MLGLAGDGLFAAFAKLIGRGEWIGDERFAKNSARVANRGVLEALIEEVRSRGGLDRTAPLGPPAFPATPAAGVDRITAPNNDGITPQGTNNGIRG